MKPHDNPDRLLNVHEVAELTSTPASWWYGRSHTKKLPIPSIRIGSYLRFRRQDVLAYIDRQVEEAPQGSPQNRPTKVTSKPANEGGPGPGCFTATCRDRASLF